MSDSIVIGDKWIEVVFHTPKKFDVDDPEGYNYLKQYGYAVFKNVATQEELKHGYELFWKFMQHSFPAVQRGNTATWTNVNWPKWTEKGIINGNGIGNSEFVWFVRGIPKVKQIFTNIWEGNNDLLVSMDAAGVTRPPEYSHEFGTVGGWFHFDQNGYQRKGRVCVQGLLNFLPSGEKDGGLVLIPETHNLFDQLFATRDDICPKSGSDFVKITKPGLLPEIWDSPKYKPVKLCLDPGDFALWDSRTAHCNHPASARETLPSSPEIRRLVSYVCMTPVTHATKSVKYLAAERLACFRDGLTTSHWPHEYQPRGAVCNSQPEFFLNDHQKALLLGNEIAAKLPTGPLSSKKVLKLRDCI